MMDEEWISVKDRRPSEKDGDSEDRVWVVFRDGSVGIMTVTSIRVSDSCTHWMPADVRSQSEPSPKKIKYTVKPQPGGFDFCEHGKVMPESRVINKLEERDEFLRLLKMAREHISEDQKPEDMEYVRGVLKEIDGALRSGDE